MADRKSKPATPKPRPACPLCAGTNYRREEIRVFDAAASEKRPLVVLICKRCSHVLPFQGGSNLYDLS